MDRDFARPLLVCLHGGGCNGGYFNLGDNSTAGAALARGMPVLLVDRPGYAGNPPLGIDRPLARSLPILRRFIDEVRALLGEPAVALLGHSTGGAVALMLAGCRDNWPLRAVAVSGIGDKPSPEVRDWQPVDDSPSVQPPLSAASLFFGPEGSYGWQAPIKLRQVAEKWLVAEILEMLRVWPQRWPSIAGTIDVPVQLRLAEHDRIWQHEPSTLKRMVTALGAVPMVDAAILPDGGHLYELHKRGPELVRAQLDFLQRVQVRLLRP